MHLLGRCAAQSCAAIPAAEIERPQLDANRAPVEHIRCRRYRVAVLVTCHEL